MILNGEPFNIYSGDNNDSILERIAVSLNTTTFWTYIDNTEFSMDSEYTAYNVIDKFTQDFVGSILSLAELTTHFQDWITSKESSVRDATEELVKMFILKYERGENAKLMLDQILHEEGGTNFTWTFISKVYDDEQLILDNLEREKLDLKKRVLQKEKQLKLLNVELDDSVVMTITDFVTENVVSTIDITTSTPIILTRVFESIKSNNNVLFVKYNDFYKVFEETKFLFSKYNYEQTNIQNVLQIVFVNYYDKKVLFREISITEISPFTFTVEVDTLQDEDVLSELENILYTNIKINSRVNTKIKGSFYILNKNFHKDLFLDEVMNNNNFFNMYTNERIKVDKKFSKINFHFYSLKTGNVSFSIGNEGKNLKIRISKIASKNNISFFMKTFSILFKEYKSREKMLLNYYRKYIPGITLNYDNSNIQDQNEINQIISKQKKFNNPLAEKEPTLFLPLYTRRCAKSPTILEEDETPPVGKQTIKFPLFNEGNLSPKTYYCNIPGFEYPGLRKNTLANSEVFKYIPCCFSTDQVKRSGSSWNTYSKNLQEKNEKYEHVLYKTSRILPNKNKGKLVQGITDLLGKDSLRWGVNVGPNAMIECVVNVMEYNAMSIEEIRKKLRYELCTQENFDIPNYREWFYNLELYFEPRRFFRALEDFFEVNIYLFERSPDYVTSYNNGVLTFKKTQSPNGILSVPNIPSRGLFIDPKRYSKNILLYTHMGGSVDSLKFPHCEYIKTQKDFTNEIETVYRHMLNNSRKDYIHSIKNIKGQILDSCGRVIKLITIDGEEKIMDKPMLPVEVEIIEDKTSILKNNILQEYLLMKRLSRVLVEYCMIKYSNSKRTLDNFFEKKCKVDPNFKYTFPANEFHIEYYDEIFTKNGKIIFESEDTKQRVRYSMEILEKRNTLKRYKELPYIYEYFQNNLDFDGIVLNENSFKSFAFGQKQGKAFNNILEDPSDHKLILFYNNTIKNLNGYFGVFTNLQEIYNEENVYTDEHKILDTCYVWNDNEYITTQYVGKGRIIVIYKINSSTHFLAKYC